MIRLERELYMDKIRPFIGTEQIKVLTGLRRSGKSVMLDLIKDELIKTGVSEKNFITLNFESLSNFKYCTSFALYEELLKRISTISGKAYLFFDEIQEVKDWEKCVNSARVDFDCDIYVTGSNAKLLSGELATYLGGRYVEFVIYPFSFKEYLECKRLAGNNASIQEEFERYILMGGMPFLANFQGERAGSMQYLRDIYNSVILKDVVKRNNIRDIDLLERISSYALANIGHVFSSRSISNYLKNENRKVAPETVLNYIKDLQESYLLLKLNREDVRGKNLLSVSEKYYVVDHGLREAVYGGNFQDIDQLLENIVYMELIRRGYKVTVGRNGEKEIDFIARKNTSKIYIQVTYLLESQNTIKREFGAYEGIKDNFPKYVISMDNFDMSRNGIKHWNIKDFLLADQWN